MNTDSLVFSSNNNNKQVGTTLIRRAKEDDAEQLIILANELMRDGKSYLTNHYGFTLAQQVNLIQNTGKNDILLVAEKNGGIIGWLTLVRNHLRFRRHSGTLIVGIQPQYQRQGIGRQLLDQCEPLALFIGIERIETSVREDNAITYNFFLKRGFIEEGRRTKSIKHNEQYSTEILMVKFLR